MDDIANPPDQPDPETPDTPVSSPAEVETPALDPRDVEIAALKDRLIRLQADFDNYRKRAARDRAEQARRACEHLLADLLPVLDHFDLGLKAARKQHARHSIVEGLDSVFQQLEQVLEKAGMKAIETVGQVFDPHVHECVAHVPSEKHPEHVIIEETRRGYRLGTFLLRAPQVIVSNGPARTGEATGDTSVS